MINIKIGEFIHEHIDNIIDFCKNNPDELNNLQDSSYSQQYMGYGVNYSFFKLENQADNARYWKDIYVIDGDSYRVCSQFGGSAKGRDNKTRSQREGENFYKYLKEKGLLLDRYKDVSIKFIVGNANEHINHVQTIPEPEIKEPESFLSIKIKNILLYGVPGVGKTHNTNKIISLLEKDERADYAIFEEIKNNLLNDGVDIEEIKDRVKFITFHQSFGYEDFIEGFRPNEEGKIELRDGVFKTICKSASENSGKNYYLVIDEINRGNISKIFGELITLIEEDKRDDLEVVLPYSQESFSIPSNLYIIATMNSTDKSIALIDIALRRRFTFLKMEPKPELVKNNKAKELMKKINNTIKENSTLGKDYLIGHSYFMNVKNDEDLEFVKEYKIMPLLEEYYYGDDNGLEQAKSILN